MRKPCSLLLKLDRWWVRFFGKPRPDLETLPKSHVFWETRTCRSASCAFWEHMTFRYFSGFMGTHELSPNGFQVRVSQKTCLFDIGKSCFLVKYGLVSMPTSRGFPECTAYTAGCIFTKIARDTLLYIEERVPQGPSHFKMGPKAQGLSTYERNGRFL